MFNRIETNPSDSLEARADQILAANPNATLALLYMGYGNIKAKFASRCRLTGDRIRRGEDIRKVKIRTATGHTFEGYLSNRTFGILAFHGGRGNNLNEDWFPGLSYWAKFDVAKVEAAIENAMTGTRIQVIDRLDCGWKNETREWTYEPHPAYRGKWVKGYAQSSPKQLLASLRRAKRAILLQVKPPNR